MKKILTCALIVALLMGMVGCGRSQGAPDSTATASQTEAPATDVTPASLEERMRQALGAEACLWETDRTAADLSGYFGLDMAKVTSFVAKESAIPSIHPDTAIILDTADGYAEEAVACLNEGLAHIVSYVRQYDMYGEKVEGARLYHSGPYVALIIAGAIPDESATPEEKARLADDAYAALDKVWTEVFGSAENLAVIPRD